jgi:hypothetical protein
VKKIEFSGIQIWSVALTGTTKDRDRIRLDDCSDILREWYQKTDFDYNV